MRLPKIVLALAAMIASRAYAGTMSGVPFPAGDAFSISANAPISDIVRHLYNGDRYAPGLGGCAADNPCTVRVKASLLWSTGGTTHLALVTAAEGRLDNTAHADGAVIGVVDLAQHDGAWTIQAGSPVVAIEGTFGAAPDLSLIRVGGIPALITRPGSENQGVTAIEWHLYLEHNRSFRRVLNLPYLLDSRDACSTDACRLHDFASDIKIISDDRSFVVEQRVDFEMTGEHTVRNFTCILSGVCREN